MPLFLLIDFWGGKLVLPELAAPGAEGASSVGGKPDALVQVLVALTAVLITG